MKNKENTLGANKQMAFLNTTKLAVALIVACLFVSINNTWGAAKYRYYYYFAQLTVATTNSGQGKVLVRETELTSPPSQGQENASLTLQDPNTYSTASNSGGGSVSFYVYATPAEGYRLKGWSSSPTKFEEIKVNMNQLSINAGTYENAAKVAEAPSNTYNAQASSWQLWNSYEYYSATNSQTIYAWFEEKQTNFNVTFAAAKGGGYYTYNNGDGEVQASGQTEELNGTTATTLTPIKHEEYNFFGWYASYDNGNTFSLLSKSSELTHTFDRQAIVYAQFIPSDAALFIIKNGDGTEYWNLNEACTKAQSSSKVVLPKANGTLYPLVDGELCKSIPEGKTATKYDILPDVTLLIPYDGNYKLHDNAERISAANNAPSCFRTLYMALGTEIIVQGRLEVGGVQNNGGQTNTAIGAPRAHGKIKMAKGSSITLKKGSHLYCWGYIVGAEDNSEGTITAESGSQIDECLQLRDWKGGSASVEIQENTHEVFPINQYYAQNIEVSITYLYGAKSFVSTGMFVVVPENIPLLGGTTFYGNADHVKFISNKDGLFNLAQGSSLIRDYDELTDRMIYLLNGDFSFDELNIRMNATFMDVNIESKNFLLPIVNNMTLHINSGTTTVNSKLLLSPGAEIYIQKDAKAIANKDIYVFDKDQWLGYEGTKIFPLLYANETEYAATASGTKKQYIRQWKDVQDAKICVDGTLQITENLYTTESGADICSTNTGKVIFNKEAPEPGVVYQVTKPTPTYESQIANPAWLHNGSIWYNGEDWKNNEWYKEDVNLEYLATKNTPADITITYANHHWGWLKIWKDWNGDILKICNTWTETLPTVEAPTDPTRECYTFKEWSTSRDYNKQEIVYTATYTQNTYTITYNAGANGIGTIESGTKNCGEDFTLSTNTFTRFGYIQTGWATTDGGEKKYELGAAYAENAALDLYPYWKKNELGPELDIVDADGTHLTINANGWASTGWPYTINSTSYEKTARKADRTLVIPYSEEPNADMPIVVKDQEGNIISSHIYKVPFIYDGNTTMSSTNANSIVFVKSGILQTTDGAEAKEIYVAPGAELEVNGTLTVGKLVLRTTPWQSAVLTIENGGSIVLTEGGQVYYSRISPDSKQYYQFGLPLSCPLANVKMSNTGKLGGSQPKYGTAWMLKSYSESSRAEKGIREDGANWDLLPSEGTITAGVGYEMFSNSNYYREFYFPVDITTATTQVSVQYTDGTIGAEHNGWNIITSPLTSRANVPIIDPATAFKVCWLQADGTYKQEQPTVIPPAIPFSYQASQLGTLTFDANLTFAAPAPRKQSAAEALTETEWVHLDIFDAYGEGDETSLFVHPTRFEQTYKTGIDVAKQSLTAARPIIYSTHAYGDMAFAGVADSLLENGIDLVVYSPSAQELTFSLRENKFLHRLEYLWLIDNKTGGRTDLLLNNYTFLAAAGTAKGRFVLNGRFKAPQISTGIGNTQTDYNIYAIGNNIAISGVEQGTPIYVFDAVGHMIYTTSATSDEVIVPAPCAGVYMLTIGGQTAKLVINQ